MHLRLYYIFYFLAVFFMLSFVISVFGGQNALTSPGLFLFNKFHLAGFYIPAILFVSGLFLKAGQWSIRKKMIFWLSPILFLTLSMALQIAVGRHDLLAPSIFMDAMGRFAASFLFFLLFLIETITFIKFSSNHNGNSIRTLKYVKTYFEDFMVKMGLAEKIHPDEYETMQKQDDDLPHMPVPEFPQEPEVPIVSKNDVGPKMNCFTEEELADSVFGGQDPYSEQLEETEDSKEPKIKPQKFDQSEYYVPVEGLLNFYPDKDFSVIDDATRMAGEILEKTLAEFKIEVKVTGIRKGPVITLYELLPAPGVKISSIVNLQDNIALCLATKSVRIVAPVPGKHAVGIEVPNKNRSVVSFSSIIQSQEMLDADMMIPMILGKDISGENQVIDLTKTPHLLIAGATGSGKSVCVNSLIGSILYTRSPAQVKMIMVDPKIVELKLYNDIPHLLTPVITEPQKAVQALKWCLGEMERRYSMLDDLGVRDVISYNNKLNRKKIKAEPLPYLVVIVDEFADLMATGNKDIEGIVARLAAMSRAVGIHLVLATQRPSVDVITGLIKANFPSRIAFMVAGKTDSRIIIDTMGAEKLLGRGDMLFTSSWNPFASRIQGSYFDDEEVERMVEFVKTLGEPEYIDDEIFTEDEAESLQYDSSNAEDPMFEKAVEVVLSTRKASASYIQRCLKLGYNRAARMIEEMERQGIVGPANGSKPREILTLID